MKILLQHPITEKPKKPGWIWFQTRGLNISMSYVDDIEQWEAHAKGCPCWYEPVELPDDAVIVQ